MKPFPSIVLVLIFNLSSLAAETEVAAVATNKLGLEIFRLTSKPGQNHLVSPYSIQCALAMTSAGADGATREEMSRVLHFPADDKVLQNSFAALRLAFETAASASAKRASDAKPGDPKRDPLQLHVANRLFGQKGYEFRQTFLATMETGYDAPMEQLDFRKSPDAARVHINDWVEAQTNKKIQDLIPQDGIGKDTRLVLTNALYFKAPWMEKFQSSATKPRPFLPAGEAPVEVPTMFRQSAFAYAKHDGFISVALPYDSGELQFLILLPNEPDGLGELAKKITPELLMQCGKMRTQDALLYLPKFKIQPPTTPLGTTLKSLGLKSAFDVPQGSANFDRMAPRKPNDYLCIGEVFHKTFLALDEEGTEAAAATAVVMIRATAAPLEPKKPIEIKVDHPFMFAIQHRESGTCLFLGQVANPK